MSLGSKSTYLLCPTASKIFPKRKLQTYQFIVYEPFRFVDYFRLSKESFRNVLDEITPKLNSGRRSLALGPEIKLATTLRFLAQGSYQTSVGNDFNISLAQPTVSKVLSEVLDACETTICRRWIKASMSEEEKYECKEYFFTKCGIPGVVGCVDGTHIKIVSPGKDDANLYYNRKGFYSLNAMVVSTFSYYKLIKCTYIPPLVISGL